MTDDRDLDGLDPYDLMDGEAARLDAFFVGLDAAAWSRPSRCEGWTVRDVLAHLVASEQYNAACLDGCVGDYLGSLGTRGVADLPSANEVGIRDLDDRSPQQLISDWRAANRATRTRFRERDGGDVDSSIGAYPARWQAFHLAFELAVHADDIGVPVSATEADARLRWQARFGRFALKELNKDLEIEAGDGVTHVRGDGLDIELADPVFVEAVAARIGEDSTLDADARTLLSATP
ncbi:MAG: maleylpyruvate isomerase family mycothiol-dependent enzyme [Acidimicrobiia bacterium]